MNSAVIVAGGRGIRLELDLPKQFHDLCGREIISYSVETFLNHPEIHEVIIVTPYDWVDHVTQNYPKCIVVEGGTRRQDSSLNGVLATNIESENILIHDAVRPFVTARVISDCLNSLEKAHVSAPIMDSTNSLIGLNDKQVSFIDRNHIKTVQTPQCFKRALILEVLNSSIDGTDEVGMLLKYNPKKKIEFVKGDPNNLKITSPTDLIIASSLLEAK